MTTFFIEAGAAQGEYVGDTADQALDAYARDAGYSDYAEVVEQFGVVDICFEIDTGALIAAVEAAIERVVFQDSYGSGVALVGGVSYATYQELAQSIGKNAWDFKA